MRRRRFVLRTKNTRLNAEKTLRVQLLPDRLGTHARMRVDEDTPLKKKIICPSPEQDGSLLLSDSMVNVTGKTCA